MSIAPFILRERQNRDPLAHVDLTDPQRELVENVARGLEVYWHASNSGAKTYGGALLGTALARGKRELGGIELPRLRSPNVGWLVVPGYKQSLDSALAAYRKALGSHPHHEAKISGSLGYVGMIYVKPGGEGCWSPECASDDPVNWSRIVVQVDQGTEPTGGRIDWAHADEPPSEKMWREVRFRGRAGEPFLRFITATPLERRYWEWLYNDFEHVLRDPRDGRYRMQSAMRENKHLTAEDLEKAEAQARNDPHRLARLFGQHVDASGDFPWPGLEPVLDRWEMKCFPGEFHDLIVQQPKDLGNDRFMTEVKIQFETWAEWDPQDSYLLFSDLASGVKPQTNLKRDPLGLQLWSWRRNMLVGRFGGYVGPHGLGWAAAEVSSRYGEAPIDFENNAGWGDPFLSGVAAWKKANPTKRCGGFRRDRTATKPGSHASPLGWNTNEATRSKIIGFVEKALLDDSCVIYSREVIGTIRHAIIDEKGKILAGTGYHDEDLILLGKAQSVIATQKAPAAPVRREPTSVQSFRETVNASFGRDVMKRERKRGSGTSLRW